MTAALADGAGAVDSNVRTKCPRTERTAGGWPTRLERDDMANVAEWREIPGTAGNYLVSDDGQVWSLPRTTTVGGVLKQGRDPAGYATVAPCVAGKQRTRRVHCLVLEAFVGPRPEGAECRHLDGDPTNNHLDNLAWGTNSENKYDVVRHGVHHNARKTHCKRGHEFTVENTYITSDGRRNCRECQRLRRRRHGETLLKAIRLFQAGA